VGLIHKRKKPPGERGPLVFLAQTIETFLHVFHLALEIVNLVANACARLRFIREDFVMVNSAGGYFQPT
jgi:hypothetical protein